MALDPRQQAFKEAYMNPASPTFSNAQQSALVAGYSEDYARSITVQGGAWFDEIRGDLERQQKADDVLDHHLSEKSLDAAKFVAKAKYQGTQKVDLSSKGEKIQVQAPAEVIKQTIEFYEAARKESLKE